MVSRTWRHAPHGTAGSTASVTSASAATPCAPSEIAFQIAMHSAHTDSPYDAFPTLQPLKTLPSTVRTAAPRRKRE